MTAPVASHDGVSRSLSFLDRARGKEAITLDLKHPDAASVVADLAARADLVVQNWSPGVAERLGVDFEALVRHNPAIVVASITGFGLDAQPDEVPTAKAMDSIIQAMSGFMLSAGAPGDPPVMNGVPVADLTAPLFAVIGSLAAVHDARRTGRGRLVDVSMLGALTSLVAAEPHGAYEALGRSSRPGRSVARLAPFGVFATADGHVALCAPTDAFAHRLLELVGLAPDDARFADRPARVANHADLDRHLDEWAARRSTAEAVAELAAVGVPAAPVRTPAEAVADPLVVRRGEVAPIVDPLDPDRPLDGVVGPGVPISFRAATSTAASTAASMSGSDGPADPDPAEQASPDGPGPAAVAPAIGEHNLAVYQDLLGYDAARLRQLESDGVI